MGYHFNNRVKVYKEVSSEPLYGSDVEEIITRP